MCVCVCVRGTHTHRERKRERERICLTKTCLKLIENSLFPNIWNECYWMLSIKILLHLIFFPVLCFFLLLILFFSITFWLNSYFHCNYIFGYSLCSTFLYEDWNKKIKLSCNNQESLLNLFFFYWMYYNAIGLQCRLQNKKTSKQKYTNNTTRIK